MNRINAQFGVSRLLTCLLPIIVLLLVQAAANGQDKAEQHCYDQVQGKVAWNKAGDSVWGEANVRSLCKGTTDPATTAATISCFKNVINNFDDWGRGIRECSGAGPKPAAQPQTTSENITRTITIKNNSGIGIWGELIGRNAYDSPDSNGDIQINISGSQTKMLATGQADTIGGKLSFPVGKDIELHIRPADNTKPFFRVTLPKNKDLTTFCYEVTGTYLVPYVKTCDGSPTYETKYIAFKNEAGYNANMSLTYYPTGSSTPRTVTTETMTAGYQRKVYLPLDADTNRQMTLKINLTSAVQDQVLLKNNIDGGAFDSSGSTCHKASGSIFSPKVNPCSVTSSARTIKLKNNGAFQAQMSVTYYDKDPSGNDVARIVTGNPIEVLESDPAIVPQGTSNTPIQVSVLNKWSGKVFFTTPVPANFTGDLCFKTEGTTFSPVGSTCDGTVGDTKGDTRQIRFQNDAGYDAQMIVTYTPIGAPTVPIFNGVTFVQVAAPTTIETGFITGLGGKFRLVTIPKNTVKGTPIYISLKGTGTVKNEIFSTTLPADFAASPQPCFKVTGTLFAPSGGKCDQ